MPAKPERLPPDSATILERSRGVFFAQWEELLRLKDVVIKTSDPDDIHDLRVASRRFRAALELYYPFAPKISKSGLRKNVRELTRILGGLRNIDEARLFLQLRANTGTPVAPKLCTALSELRSAELKRIGKAIKSFDHDDYDRDVRQIVAGLTQGAIAGRNRFSLLSYFSEVSIRSFLPIHRLLAVAGAPERMASRHALRIAIKKWRYLLEIMEQVLGRDYTRILELLKEYQTLLGRMNDMAEFGLLFSRLELFDNELTDLKAILLAEDARLLGNLNELIERKPLAYTFLI